MRKVIASFRRFVLHDELRFLEMLSVAGLFWWSSHLPAVVPGANVGWMLALVGICQAAAMVARHFGWARRRFEAMALAAGAWTSIAWVLSRPDLVAAAVACFYAGIYLGWKPTSCHS